MSPRENQVVGLGDDQLVEDSERGTKRNGWTSLGSIYSLSVHNL